MDASITKTVSDDTSFVSGHTFAATDSRRAAADRSADLTHRRVREPETPSPQTRVDFQTLYAPVAEPLRDVEHRLRKELDSKHDVLRPVLQHGTQLGGKRLRPALLLLAAKLCGQVTEEHTLLGVVIEMVHTATLAHDDVLDHAATRRHTPTINAKWNNHTGILVGDFLFAQSFSLTATLSSTRACVLIGEASRRVCEGELRQVMLRDHAGIDEATYLEILSDKTAELCRVACVLGAEYAGADEAHVNQLECFGCNLGIAFQIADDYLDVWGDESSVGKTLGTDLESGKFTLPIIRLLDQASPIERREVIEILAGQPSDRYRRLRAYFDSSDARSYTLAVAKQYQQQAIEALASFEDSDAKRSLLGLAELSVDRNA